MKKNLLTVIILALLVVNIVLTSVLMFSVMATNNKTAELVTNIATVMNLELTVPGQDEPAEVISIDNTDVYNLSNMMTIPLAKEETSDKQRYIMFEISLSMNMKHEHYKKYSETLLDREKLIEDAITSVVGVRTEAECNDMEGLKDDILKAIQEDFQSDFIYKVGISNVKFG